MRTTHVTVGRRVLIALATSMVLLAPGSAMGAMSTSFQLTSDAVNQATTSILHSTNYAADVSAETWVRQPLRSSDFLIVPAWAGAMSSSASSASSTSTSTSSTSASTGGIAESTNRRPRPTQSSSMGTSSTESPTHGAASSSSVPSSVAITPTELPQGTENIAATVHETTRVLPGQSSVPHRFFEAVEDACAPQDQLSTRPPSCVCEEKSPGFATDSLHLILLVAGVGLIVELRRKKMRFKKHPRVYILAIAIIGFLLLHILLTGFGTKAHAADTVPLSHVYNGHLLSAGGVPITTPHTIRFSYWTSADAVDGDTTGTGAINTGAATYAGWQEVHTVTPDANGYFSVALGTIHPLPDFATMSVSELLSLHLQVDVKAATNPDSAYELLDVDPTDPAIDRSGILSVPFAINADMIDQHDIGGGSGNIPVLETGGLLPMATVPGGTNADTFTIDANNTGTSEIGLRFGETLGKTLTYDIGASTFRFNDNVSIQGNLTVSGLVNGVNLGALQSSTGALKAFSGGGLMLNVSGGSYRLNGKITNYPGGSIVLPPNSSSAVFFGSGGLTASALGFPSDESFIPIAEVLTSPGAILSLVDRRALQSDDRERTVITTYSPTYEKVSYEGDGSNNVGQLSVLADNISLRNYYSWTSTRTTLQDYDILLRIPVPENFSHWNQTPTEYPIALTYRTTSADPANSKLDIHVYDTNGNPVTLSGATSNLAATSWSTTYLRFGGAPTWAPGQDILIRLTPSAKDGFEAHVGTLRLSHTEFSPK